ncbi:MAG: hypothetical protein H7Z43_09505 [Clostridia bacterium]|nr:hypothetical protein [Deltaproteobacteria bacterium]
MSSPSPHDMSGNAGKQAISANADKQADIIAALPELQRKYLDPAAGPARMMAARGLAPLPPRDMVVVLAGLALDADEQLSAAAKASLAKLPDKIYVTALTVGLPQAAMLPVAEALNGRDAPLEKIVLLRDTPDDIVAGVALKASEYIAEIIANDQERLLRSRAVVQALRANTALLRSSAARVFDFLVRSGVIYDDMPESNDALTRLSSDEFQKVADSVELPLEVQALIENAPLLEQSPVETALAAAADEADGEKLDQALDSKITPEDKEKRIPLLKLLTKLNIAQKVALAMKGNKEARGILVRDSNRLVAVAAIRSPRMTQSEAQTIAKSRTVHDEVIRFIAMSKELSRSYAVKLALAGNPKTPLPMAMKLLPLLRDSDVKLMAKSKMVSAAIATQARRLVTARTQRGK